MPVCPILVNRTNEAGESGPQLSDSGESDQSRVVRVQARTPVPQAPVRRTRSTGVCWIPAVA